MFKTYSRNTVIDLFFIVKNFAINGHFEVKGIISERLYIFEYVSVNKDRYHEYSLGDRN